MGGYGQVGTALPTCPATASILLSTHAKALFLHKAHRTLLHCVQCTRQRSLPIHDVCEIIADVVVDLVDRRPPLERHIYVRRLILEELPDVLVTEEWEWSVYQG